MFARFNLDVDLDVALVRERSLGRIQPGVDCRGASGEGRILANVLTSDSMALRTLYNTMAVSIALENMLGIHTHSSGTRVVVVVGRNAEERDENDDEGEKAWDYGRSEGSCQRSDCVTREKSVKPVDLFGLNLGTEPISAFQPLYPFKVQRVDQNPRTRCRRIPFKPRSISQGHEYNVLSQRCAPI